MESSLSVSDLVVRYGEVSAVRGISISVGAGEVVALIGRNGAGKTTTLRCIAGSLGAAGGSINLGGRNVTKLPAHRRARLGIALVPEGRRIFRGLSVLENLRIGGEHVRKGGDRERLEFAFEMFPRLRDRRRQLGWSLSGGEQQMLAIARALMGEPKVLMLDEPSLGLAPMIVDEVFETISHLQETGLSILLVEQNSAMALQVASRGYIMATGEVVLGAETAELRERADITGLYFG